MAAARFSPGAHHAWFGYWQSSPAEAPLVIHRRHTAHYVGYVEGGRFATRWVTRSIERNYRIAAGTVRFYPADQERHTFIAQPDPDSTFYILVIPTTDEQAILDSECMKVHGHLRHLHAPNDVELLWCMRHLASHSLRGDACTEREDEAARRLVLQLVRLSSGAMPDWHADGGVFDRRTLRHLVDYIDAHLKFAPCLSDMAMLAGLSPSHFAKKFRQSTGMSLHRFINRRRIRASMDLLRSQSSPLAHVALELGFSSQSHFTRLFSELTGMTPAKYRRQFKPIVG